MGFGLGVYGLGFMVRVGVDVGALQGVRRVSGRVSGRLLPGGVGEVVVWASGR